MSMFTTYQKFSKLNLGCGDVKKEGYLNIDLYGSPDLIHDISQPLPFEDNSIDEIYASHVVEHLSRDEWKRAKKDWVRVLKNGGKIEIICPEIDQCLANFVTNYRGQKWGYWIATIYGNQEGPGQFHKNGFNYDKLENDLREEGIVTFKRIQHVQIELHIVGEKHG